MKTPWTSWIWRQIGFCLPADWEMLQYSKKPGRGRCTFADRYAFRFELVWSEVPGAPDYDRMLKDYRTRLELSENLEQAAEEQYGDWMAVSGRQDDRAVTRFGRHFPELGLMAEFVVLHPETRDVDLEQAIIKSGREVPASSGIVQCQAFGIHAFVNEHYPLTTATVAPARIHLHFKHPKNMEQCSVERIGMLSHWLQGPLDAWFESQHPKSVRNWKTETIQQDVTTYHLGRGTLPGTKRFGPPRQIELAAWIHPEDGRLYRCRTIQQDALPDGFPWERTLRKQSCGPLGDFTP